MASIAKIGTKTFNTLAEAATAVTNGQEVYVTRSGSGAEVTAAFTKAGEFKILGTKDANGAIPKLQLDLYTRPAYGKALINLEDGNYEIGYLHLDGTAVPDSNGAGIRLNGGTDVVNVHHVRLSNNENGILTAGGSATKLYISDSVFESNGKSTQESRRGYSHNIYTGADQLLECVRVSFLKSAFGHDLKARAKVVNLTQVLCEGANAGRALDYPNGGTLRAVDCKFAKPASSAQNNLIDIGAEGIAAGTVEKYEFVNCEFHNDVQINRAVEFIKNRSKVEVVLIDPLFTGAAAEKDRKATLVGNIRVELTGGPLGPRVPVGGDPGATSTVPAPTPDPTTPAPQPEPEPTNPGVQIPDVPVIPGVDTLAWLNLLAHLIGDAKRNTTLTVEIKANEKDGLTKVSAAVTHPAK